MNLIHREVDVILGGNDLEALHSFKRFPVFMGTATGPAEDDLIADMDVFISRNSGCIQLNPLLPLDTIYSEAHGSGLVGNLWMQHHKAFAHFVQRYQPSSILEIGGSHGILSKFFHEQGNCAIWTIIEPNPTPAVGVTARFVKGFFDEHFVLNEEIDTIVHSHVFEHVYDPKLFVRDIANFLQEGKHLLFSLPNMEAMLQRKYNCINFEHTILLTESYVEFLLHQQGFRVLEKEYFMDDHSIFYACIRDQNVLPTELPSGLYEHNKTTYLNYVHYHEELIEEINSKIMKLGNDQMIYLFGAHIFSQLLIGFGLDTGRIECILDNDSNKQGRRLYGTDLTVFSPKILKDVLNPVIVLKAGVYSEEIMNDIIKNINSNCTFLD